MSEMDMVIKRLGSQPALTLRRTFSTWDEITQVGKEIQKALASYPIKHTVPFMDIYYGDEVKLEDIDFEFVILVDEEQTKNVRLESAGILQLRELPAVEMAATHLHQGDLTGLAAKLALVQHWAEENGYKLCGVTRIIHHRGPMHQADPTDYLTEFQHEIERA